jgi:hypothetical protein
MMLTALALSTIAASLWALFLEMKLRRATRHTWEMADIIQMAAEGKAVISMRDGVVNVAIEQED